MNNIYSRTCIYDKESEKIFDNLTDTIKNEWKKYCQKQADKYNEKNFGLDRNTSTVYQWTPPLSISEWIKQRK